MSVRRCVLGEGRVRLCGACSYCRFGSGIAPTVPRRPPSRLLCPVVHPVGIVPAIDSGARAGAAAARLYRACPPCTTSSCGPHACTSACWLALTCVLCMLCTLCPGGPGAGDQGTEDGRAVCRRRHLSGGRHRGAAAGRGGRGFLLATQPVRPGSAPGGLGQAGPGANGSSGSAPCAEHCVTPAGWSGQLVAGLRPAIPVLAKCSDPALCCLHNA